MEFFALLYGFIDLRVMLGFSLILVSNLKNLSLMKTIVYIITALGVAHLNGEFGHHLKGYETYEH